MSFSNEHQQRIEELLGSEEDLILEDDYLVYVQRSLEQGSPALKLLVERQNRVLREYECIQKELDSIQAEEGLTKLSRREWLSSKFPSDRRL